MNEKETADIQKKEISRKGFFSSVNAALSVYHIDVHTLAGMLNADNWEESLAMFTRPQTRGHD